MARKPTKSNAVREVLTTNPGKPVAEIVKELKVTPSLVYNIKSNMKNKRPAPTAVARRPGRKPGRKPGSKPGRRPSRTGAAPDSAHAALDSAFEFAVKVGGLLRAEELLTRLRAIKEGF